MHFWFWIIAVKVWLLTCCIWYSLLTTTVKLQGIVCILLSVVLNTSNFVVHCWWSPCAPTLLLLTMQDSDCGISTELAQLWDCREELCQVWTVPQHSVCKEDLQTRCKFLWNTLFTLTQIASKMVRDWFKMECEQEWSVLYWIHPRTNYR